MPPILTLQQLAEASITVGTELVKRNAGDTISSDKGFTAGTQILGVVSGSIGVGTLIATLYGVAQTKAGRKENKELHDKLLAEYKGKLEEEAAKVVATWVKYSLLLAVRYAAYGKKAGNPRPVEVDFNVAAPSTDIDDGELNPHEYSTLLLLLEQSTELQGNIHSVAEKLKEKSKEKPTDAKGLKKRRKEAEGADKQPKGTEASSTAFSPEQWQEAGERMETLSEEGSGKGSSHGSETGAHKALTLLGGGHRHKVTGEHDEDKAAFDHHLGELHKMYPAHIIDKWFKSHPKHSESKDKSNNGEGSA